MNAFMHLKFSFVVESDRTESTSVFPHDVVHLLNHSRFLCSNWLAGSFTSVSLQWILLLIFCILIATFCTGQSKMKVLNVTFQARIGSKLFATYQARDSVIRKC